MLQTGISIVIPVFNTELYLARCLDSVTNQSFQNTEIIIVNDGSTDGSHTLIQKYLQRDARINYIQLDENIGVGNARNIGIEQATKEYVGFIDSDDWLDLYFYELLHQAIEQTQCDIAVGGMKTDFDNALSSTQRYQYGKRMVITNHCALRLLTNVDDTDSFISPIVNNKLYKKSFLQSNRLAFDKKRAFQDDAFSFFSILNAEKIVLVPETNYHY